MSNYLVASDLSARSDAALSRAVALLRADRQRGQPARITLLHVVDEAICAPASATVWSSSIVPAEIVNRIF